VAIQLCLRRAAASGFGAEGRACDASDLSCFDTGSFDLVFACAALHHTLKYPGAVEELARVVRPGGFLVITETWGGNPLLNALRRLGWRAGGQQAEQGEEVLFDAAALARLQPHFDLITAEYRNLLAMAKRLFRGRFDRTGVRLLLRTLEAADSVLLAAFPFLAPYCGEVVVVAKRRLPAGVPS
jgi:SAM-dependent methyltransferase